MWNLWVKYVNPKRIMEITLLDVSDRAVFTEVYKILTHDVRYILMPSHRIPEDLERGTFYEEAAMMQRGANNAPEGETTVERISTFLETLPSRFPAASTRTILERTMTILLAAMRDITIGSGDMCRDWWATNILVDELAIWYSSLGGFLNSEQDLSRARSAERNSQGVRESAPVDYDDQDNATEPEGDSSMFDMDSSSLSVASDVKPQLSKLQLHPTVSADRLHGDPVKNDSPLAQSQHLQFSKPSYPLPPTGSFSISNRRPLPRDPHAGFQRSASASAKLQHSSMSLSGFQISMLESKIKTVVEETHDDSGIGMDLIGDDGDL